MFSPVNFWVLLCSALEKNTTENSLLYKLHTSLNSYTLGALIIEKLASLLKNVNTERKYKNK